MNDFVIRTASRSDAEGVAAVLQELVAAGKRSKSSDVDFAASHYITHPDQIVCTVALDAGSRVLGFQSLKRAVGGNPYGAPVGWGVIGTHIRPSAARRGIGRALFQNTLTVARASGIPAIDATISASNAEGLAYYDAIGFVDYRQHGGAVSKAFAVSNQPRGCAAG
ncbi:GNAT family N-acetyltransferase [Ruegeria halocynthiae]|uniref:GNAT family N-acetyltransferase n=1 Tax=Ruegeria halocynthiae TaxID=985054 RepID=UPI000A7F4B22|nr:GNAT family N-acetyltransferase [Ruegeria halocynthiae]